MSENHARITDAEDAPKKSWLSKIIGWVVAIIILIVVAQFIAGLQSDQKARFVAESRSLAETACAGDAACLAAVSTKLDICLELYSESHKSGKFSRKYTLNKESFLACMK
ncbi:hypothetical protein H8L32_16495 [Undibacterium sp. CY18W]|uniref:Uncharacterized protein n=1 Tax=Undibacterium hunanense TaxID=2762292 RepID=A0ABR6ZT56_9BURK|nr:hypothetical protein [Undibacterium hunanense]MBC3919092.1 hypothetical protein [Undibacterium hunanense]